MGGTQSPPSSEMDRANRFPGRDFVPLGDNRFGHFLVSTKTATIQDDAMRRKEILCTGNGLTGGEDEVADGHLPNLVGMVSRVGMV